MKMDSQITRCFVMRMQSLQTSLGVVFIAEASLYSGINLLTMISHKCSIHISSVQLTVRKLYVFFLVVNSGGWSISAARWRL